MQVYTELTDGNITSIAFDSHGVMHCCCQTMGAIYKMKDGNTFEMIANTGGSPFSICFDEEDHMYIADLVHKSVLCFDGESLFDFLKDSGDEMFKGPSCVQMTIDGLVFTDSGPLGETGIQKPQGSVYVVKKRSFLVVALQNCLAYPSSIAVSPDGDIYVAETSMNRILKITQYPTGVFQTSVFAQLSGGFGPTALTINDRFVIVGQSDFSQNTPQGRVLLLSKDGTLSRSIDIPPTHEKVHHITDVHYRNGNYFVVESKQSVVYQFTI
eukprot:TRINITY_DN2800_c0_g1_i1.p1 TRINITY_DN2800_c0_g1~~TRINITY_DN2800_c0_g1_i1.p1  ORF type:complete len:269 (+),score=67.50 TRINITY_DN2800_c0_g1_i1:27-833(+)